MLPDGFVTGYLLFLLFTFFVYEGKTKNVHENISIGG
jgi:hypothetical protein